MAINDLLKYFLERIARKVCMVAYLLACVALLVGVIEILELPAMKLGIKTFTKITLHDWLRMQFPDIGKASVFDLLGGVVGIAVMLFLWWLFVKLFDKPTYDPRKWAE